MTSKKKRFHGLDPWRPAAVAQEFASHAMLVGFAIWFGIGYLGLMLVFMAEIVIGNLISAALYPERGLGKHLWDLVKILAAMAFLLVFVVATCLVATDDGSGENPLRRLQVDSDAVLAAIAFAALHLSALYLVARRQADPRFAWTKSVLMQNAATLIGLFLMIFVAAFVGPVAAGLLKTMGWGSAPDAALIACMALVRLSLALLLTRMPEREAREIAAAPYID